jgi:pimeloyl-ACP methyl ester carboxylesterase
MHAPSAAVQSAARERRSGTVRLKTGPRLHYVEQGDPTGQPIVFLHGYTDSWYSFCRLLSRLPASYHAFALDQRGHGDSERPISGYTPDSLAADVAAFLDAVEVDRATIVGHSMGSIVGRRVAELYPQRVSRLVLIGAILAANDATRELQEAVRGLDGPVPTDFARDFQLSTIHAPVPQPFLNRVVDESLKVPARVWRSALDGVFSSDDGADLGRIGAPTLILWGEQDAYFLRDEQERLASAITGARLTIYPATGHSPHWERPERVANDLDAFLRVTPSSDGAAPART